MMHKLLTVTLFIGLILLFGCSSSKISYSPDKKFPKNSLLEDYRLLRKILEQKHPSLYWYTPKDSMDYFFEKYEAAITDSMTERSFAWKVLVPLTAKIRCGHTSVSLSKSYEKWAEGKIIPSFPLSMKVWNDTMAVVGNLNRKDTVIRRGTIIRSVNGIPSTELIRTMMEYLPRDGYADNINYMRVGSNFRNYHRNIFGISKEYKVTYDADDGRERTAILPLFVPDTSKRKLNADSLRKATRQPKMKRLDKLEAYRSLKIDSAQKAAYLTLNTFSNGHLRKFFRRSFRTLRKKNITELAIDIRNNGGGRVGLSTLLTRYLSRKDFKVADSLYAKTQSLHPYTKHIKGRFLNNLEMMFISSRQKDGNYHIRHLEGKTYSPKKKNHYNGNLYLLISGPSFSASTLVANTLKGQVKIVLLGEETGGGWHGNNGIMIPDIILPLTKMRVRLPLYRLVQYEHVPKNGTGVVPDIYVGTSYEALLKGYDQKQRVAMQLMHWQGAIR
jgi:hypothetical protein